MTSGSLHFTRYQFLYVPCHDLSKVRYSGVNVVMKRVKLPLAMQAIHVKVLIDILVALFQISFPRMHLGRQRKTA